MITVILGYCRPGFEADAGLELQTLASERGFYGYFKSDGNSGFYLFECHSGVEGLFKMLPLSKLVFTRQWFLLVKHCQNLPLEDRISALRPHLINLPILSEIRVEHPDTELGKELSKFCRKFTVPIRQTLKSLNIYAEQHQTTCLFLFFVSSSECYVGYSPLDNISDLPCGILRLRFPEEAPSRSTLKLDEAFIRFVPAKERGERLKSGMQAVDLGACPGGWTYQLVRRGMFVQSIDNGLMAESLMDTGQVKHVQADGFKYEPKKKNVYWLVCDMIEQPQKVARLMASWVAKDWCKEAMFNLKLPMKKRYGSVTECFDIISQVLKQRYEIQAKHLYHDRDEITVHLRKI